MPHLPEYESIPAGLATKTRLRERGLVPTGDPVATYRFHGGGEWRRVPLYEVKTARNEKDAQAAKKRRLANIHGQYSMFPENP